VHVHLGAASLLLGLVAWRSAAAQRGDPDTFLRPADLAWAGAFAVGSFGISRFDPSITKYFQQPARQNDRTLRQVADVFTHVQETTLTMGGFLTYGIARLSGARQLEKTALHATEAIVAASLTSQVIRGPLGRARPKDATPIFEDQYEFHWFNGFSHFQYRAFPSIHASSAFAAATAIVAETHRRSPEANWYVAPIVFTLAAAPGFSRIYLGQHWASDIFMGAFVGAFYGTRIVDYAHAHPDNKVDRFFIKPPMASGVSVIPENGRIAVVYSQQF
jgi:membrane-associated phospholipid phosphatase